MGSELDAIVVAARGEVFTCEYQVNGVAHRVSARRGGRLRLAHARILPGDNVRIELVDREHARIVRRLDDRVGAP